MVQMLQLIRLYSPTAPAAGPVLLGYRIYRNNVMIDTIMNPNNSEFYDYNLNPGTYAYRVDAMYNVTPFTPSPRAFTACRAGFSFCFMRLSVTIL